MGALFRCALIDAELTCCRGILEVQARKAKEHHVRPVYPYIQWLRRWLTMTVLRLVVDTVCSGSCDDLHVDITKRDGRCDGSTERSEGAPPFGLTRRVTGHVDA